jgi:hypothetical protein
MKALRSSTIKMLGSLSGNVLFNKISIGEDQAELSSVFFDKGLAQSGLIPKAKQTKWVGDTDSCLYDIQETKIETCLSNSFYRIYLKGFTNISQCYDTKNSNGISVAVFYSYCIVCVF